jgi:hypothetical protein
MLGSHCTGLTAALTPDGTMTSSTSRTIIGVFICNVGV